MLIIDFYINQSLSLYWLINSLLNHLSNSRCNYIIRWIIILGILKFPDIYWTVSYLVCILFPVIFYMESVFSFILYIILNIFGIFLMINYIDINLSFRFAPICIIAFYFLIDANRLNQLQSLFKWTIAHIFGFILILKFLYANFLFTNIDMMIMLTLEIFLINRMIIQFFEIGSVQYVQSLLVLLFYL